MVSKCSGIVTYFHSSGAKIKGSKLYRYYIAQLGRKSKFNCSIEKVLYLSLFSDKFSLGVDV